MGIAPVEKLSVPVYVFVPDRELDFLTNIHVKLDTLVDTQESFSTSDHRTALEYNEDTVILVIVPTLSTSDISISDNSDSSTGNTSAFEYECYEVKDDIPWFNYHRPKIKILKQESPANICTTDTIGTIRSWTMQGIRLPDFNKNRCINQQKVLVFDNNVKYEIILGTNFFPRPE